MADLVCPQCGADVPLAKPEPPIRARLSALIDSGVSADVAAEKVVGELPSAVAGYVLAPVRREADTIARDRVRRVEKVAIGSRERWDKAHSALRERLLAQRFALGGGVEVSWGEATVDQHRQRMGLLDEQAAGIRESRLRHSHAIDVIVEAGASCLAEVPGGERVLADDAKGPSTRGSRSTLREGGASGNGGGKRSGGRLRGGKRPDASDPSRVGAK